MNILEEAKHWYLATFLYLVPRSTGHLVNGQAMRFATLCSLCLICSASNRDMSKGFPYPPDTRPEGCRKYKRRSWVGPGVGGVYEGHILEEWMNLVKRCHLWSFSRLMWKIGVLSSKGWPYYRRFAAIFFAYYNSIQDLRSVKENSFPYQTLSMACGAIQQGFQSRSQEWLADFESGELNMKYDSNGFLSSKPQNTMLLIRRPFGFGSFPEHF